MTFNTLVMTQKFSLTQFLHVLFFIFIFLAGMFGIKISSLCDLKLVLNALRFSDNVSFNKAHL